MDKVIALTAVTKAFGPVRALGGVDFAIAPGEVVGLVGHNGAGKSTMVNIMMGTFPPTEGRVERGAAGEIRCVFQELSLCLNLDAAENTRLIHRSLRGLGWRRRARAMIAGRLDAIFPGHGIPPEAKLSDLPIGQRQMVEIARAFTAAEGEGPLAMVILDEPTSALGEEATQQFLAYVRKAAGEGVAIVLITHRLNEIYAVSHRIVVMKDGRSVAEGPSAELPKERLVELMGGHAVPVEGEDIPAVATRKTDPNAPVMVTLPGAVPVEARKGDIIGFTGLDGHGQREALVAIQTEGRGAKAATAFVAGDRQADGVLPVWSIAQNLTISCLATIRRGAFLSPAAERAFAEEWRERIGIRMRDIDQPLTELSGGNQQKVLFARALAAPAPIVLLDDPMRGVDVGTKAEVYQTIRNEADAGRTFVWFSTELEELENCDRVYVFREGAPVACIPREALSQDAIIAASFQS
ncbi:sugar ABC transporter ATP-binding protein [Acidimangrovimonas sediminis]|uniref:sugar ABC transporter ATP-binding protein n=1 Tax=Acidimangrovimonas sediminis TaxID=2056283 RepID=UPI000C80FBDA|nr:sugar ABC transporter ATP-binding protein [Acidimangrovimonas sediminis]